LTHTRLRRGFVCLLLLLPSHTATQSRPERESNSRTFRVLHYDVQIEPDLPSQSVAGTVVIRFLTLAAPVSSVEFDCGDLTVDADRIGGHDLVFHQQDHRLVVFLRTRAKAHETQAIEVAYHGTPRRGVSFYADAEQVYTAFATSEWMVYDAPDEKATIRLSVIVPSSWRVVASGRTIAQETLPHGRML
jgi:aminopeptidase N